MGKLISTHIEARWTIPDPSSSKSRGARQRGRVLLAASPSAVLRSARQTREPVLLATARLIPKAKTT